MIKKLAILIMTVFCTIIVSCGHHVSKNDYIIVPNRGFATAANNEACVYFLFVEKDRENTSLAIFRNENMIGALTGGTYFYDKIKAGQYQYWLDSGLVEKSRERLTLTVEAGKSYYVRYFPGGFYVVSKLDLISEDVARAYIGGLNFTELKHH